MWLHGHACDDSATSPEDAIGSSPKECLLDVSEYNASAVVQNLCNNKLPHWINNAAQVDLSGDCSIDPTTMQMVCNRTAQCSGGSIKTAHIEEIQQVLTYNCGASCKGALLIDCCETCKHHRNDPAGLSVDNITCLGCSDEEVQLADEVADCLMNQRVFRCESRGKCAAGVQETSCKKTDIACSVIPCDACTNPDLKSQCCADCLNKLCSAGGPEDRMVCQGCDTLPGEQWWPFR